MAFMNAVICEEYGPPEVLTLANVEQPVPKNDEILIRLHATTVTSGDCRIRGLNVPRGFALLTRLALGVRRPRQHILGTEFAGEVISMGKDVADFHAGDQLFGLRGVRMGCYAEYICMPARGTIARTPANITTEEAAALSFGGTTALDFFRRGNIRSGERVLVNGASGAVGTAAVQLAKYFGAEVTAVCSAPNVDLVRSLGAAHVIDYTREDFTQNGETYDVIIDTAGTAPFARSERSLKAGGRLLLVLAGLPEMLRIPWTTMTSTKRIIAGSASERPEDLRLLAKLASEGAFKPVIDRRYPLEEIVEAHRYVDTGRKKGNVVITIDHRSTAKYEHPMNETRE